MTPVERIRRLDPHAYEPHPLHDLDRDWPETNCYVDVWIEILASLGLQVEASLGFLLASRFEGDQWTFVKPPHLELESLYGVRVEELTLWRDVMDHVQLQTERGRLVLIEADSFHLTDTRGTDYRVRHTKTGIAVASVDRARRELTYFHNRGLHRLAGEDFDALFDLGGDPRRLPPYCEIADIDRVAPKPDDELRELARRSARLHLSRRPDEQPVDAYAAAFGSHLQSVMDAGLDAYHAYSFASLRQLGACAELLGSYARWLDPAPAGHGARAAEALQAASRGVKTLVLKSARMVAARRVKDVAHNLADISRAWSTGVGEIAAWVDA